MKKDDKTHRLLEVHLPAEEKAKGDEGQADGGKR